MEKKSVRSVHIIINCSVFILAGDPKCPVLSYTKYVIHLHPMSDAFWQRPKRNVLPTDFVWFDNICIGNSTLNKLMNRITQSAGELHLKLRVFSVEQPLGSASPLQLSDLPTVYTTTNQKSALNPAFYAKAWATGNQLIREEY